MKKIFLLLFLITVTVCPVMAETENGRGFYFDVKLGTSTIDYPDSIERPLKILKSIDEIDHTILNLGITLGYAITDKLYFVGGISGIADRYSYKKNIYNVIFICIVLD